MSQDLNQRLELSIQRRDKLISEANRLKGKLEAAHSTLKSLEDECVAKGVQPDRIDDVIQQLQARYQSLVEKLEQDIVVAEQSLAPYLKEMTR